jgi:predicted lipase
VEATAIYLARVTSVAYCGAKHIRNWSCSPCALVDPLEDIHVLEDVKDKFQGLVGYNKDRNEVIVAFRGSMDISNWIDNLTFIKKKPYVQYPDVRVHQGFYWVYQSVEKQVVPAVKALLAAHPTASVMVTGHSLGGAVAALCSFDLALIHEIPVAMVYTFGEPRVGNANFSALINQAISGYFRVTHFRDVVPHLPPSWIGFRHGVQEVFTTVASTPV